MFPYFKNLLIKIKLNLQFKGNKSKIERTFIKYY